MCFVGGENKYEARDWVYCCVAAFLFHNLEPTHKGPLTAIVMDHAETEATKGALKKSLNYTAAHGC